MMAWVGHRTRVAFLVSGNGQIFVSVAKAIQDGHIRAKTGVVITDNKEAGVRKRAMKLGIPVKLIDPDRVSDRHSHEGAIIQILEDHGTELIVLAGFLRILSSSFVRRYPNRIINVHPSLLPSFRGLQSQRKAIEYGVKISGCTVHFVDDGIDTGPIICQKAVTVENDDTERSLSMKIRKAECLLLTKAVKLYCEEQLTVMGRRVFIRTK